MPISYSAAMPPWVGQPADPAGHYAQGFQIGVHVGAQQAANAFQQQQVALQQQRQLMAQQQQEVENQMQAQVLSLKASEMAQKHRANMEFRSRIAAGEDPANVLMQLAPDLGENPASVLHDQRMRDEAQAATRFKIADMERRNRVEQATEAYRQRREERMDRALEERNRQFDRREQRLKANAEYRVQQAAEQAILKDSELKTLRDTEATLKSNISAISGEGWQVTHPLRTESVRNEEKKAAEKSLAQTQADIAKREQEIRGHFKSMLSEVQPEGEETTSTGELPKPPTPSAPAPTGTRVRVKSPDGRKGYIPAAQLEAALKQGYQEID